MSDDWIDHEGVSLPGDRGRDPSIQAKFSMIAPMIAACKSFVI
jgi:hypothetical protein